MDVHRPDLSIVLVVQEQKRVWPVNFDQPRVGHVDPREVRVALSHDALSSEQRRRSKDVPRLAREVLERLDRMFDVRARQWMNVATVPQSERGCNAALLASAASLSLAQPGSVLSAPSRSLAFDERVQPG